jgi:hypothetical protein
MAEFDIRKKSKCSHGSKSSKFLELNSDDIFQHSARFIDHQHQFVIELLSTNHDKDYSSSDCISQKKNNTDMFLICTEQYKKKNFIRSTTSIFDFCFFILQNASKHQT